MANGDKKDPQPWNKSRIVIEQPEPEPQPVLDRSKIDPYSPRYKQRLQKRESRRT